MIYVIGGIGQKTQRQGESKVSACSSMVEQLAHNEEGVGSSPIRPTAHVA